MDTNLLYYVLVRRDLHLKLEGVTIKKNPFLISLFAITLLIYENELTFILQQVGLETNSSEVQCLCNQLTSFAGQVVVAPSAIDFDKALTGFLELSSISSNSIVLSTVVSIFGIYILLLIWARRLDLRSVRFVFFYTQVFHSRNVHLSAVTTLAHPWIVSPSLH